MDGNKYKNSEVKVCVSQLLYVKLDQEQQKYSWSEAPLLWPPDLTTQPQGVSTLE